MPIFKAPNGDTFRTDTKQQEDWLEISEQELLDHLQTRAAGGPSFAGQKAALFTKFRADRERMTVRLEMLANRAFRAGDAPKAAVCETLSDALLDITTHATVTAAADMETLEQAMEALYDAAVYAAITNPAAPSLLADFQRMDE